MAETKKMSPRTVTAADRVPNTEVITLPHVDGRRGGPATCTETAVTPRPAPAGSRICKATGRLHPLT